MRQSESVYRGIADMERTRKPKPLTSPPNASHSVKSDSTKTKPKLEIDPAQITPDPCTTDQPAPKQPGETQPHAHHPQFHPREFNARELDYVVTAITTGRQLERLADAVAEAVMTKLSRYQRLELDAQFIADAVVKRIEEERLVSRIVGEIVSGAASADSGDASEPTPMQEKQHAATGKSDSSEAAQGSHSVSEGADLPKRSSRRKKP
jgi:hypothetical protein